MFFFFHEMASHLSQLQEWLKLLHSEEYRSEFKQIAENGTVIDWETPLPASEAASVLFAYDGAKQLMPIIGQFPEVAQLIPVEVLNGFVRILRDIQPVENLLRPYANGEWNEAQFEHEVLKSAIRHRRRNRFNPAISKLLSNEV